MFRKGGIPSAENRSKDGLRSVMFRVSMTYAAVPMVDIPCNPVMILMASRACMLPMIPVTAPRIPVSAHDPVISGEGGLGNRHL